MFHILKNNSTLTLYGAVAGRFNHIRLIRAVSVVIITFAIGLLLSLPAPARAQGVPDIDENTFVIMAYGDSLMSGHGIEKELAFPAQLERALRELGYNVRVINMAKSGDTTISGMKRLEWSLRTEPDMVILGLGANDALRGIKPKYTRTNLAQMIYTLRSKEIEVLLAGMMAPPNMGAGYGAQFNGIYAELAHYYSIPLYPFLLHGVAGKPALNNEDGIHPNPDGVAVMVQGIIPYVERMLPDYSYVDPSLPPKDPAAYGGLDQ